jgi:hypothetical protein
MPQHLMQLHRPRGRLLPAFAMLALHGAFLLAWLGTQRPAAQPEAASFIYATMVPAPRPLAKPKPIVRPRVPPPQAAPAQRAPAPAAPVVAAADAPSQADPAVADAPAGLLEQARSSAGAIDLALRDGRPLPPLVRGDTPYARFERALEGAYVGGPRTVVMDRYIAADGVVITRVTERGRVRCYMNGSVNARNTVLTDTSRPQGVGCPPSNAGWTRL